jgi:hypothetical protein
MRLGEWVVSFEGYKHKWDNKTTLGPARGKQEWAGGKLGLTEQCDFNSNDWHSYRYDFDKNGYYFDNSVGDYPFSPHSMGLRDETTWVDADRYMLWEPWAWKKQGFGTADNFRSAKGLMEESVWKQLTDKYQYIGYTKDDVRPLDIIKAHDLTQNDLSLEKIYLYKEWDSKEKFNEAHKAEMVRDLEEQIERIETIPYGKGI